MSVAIDEMLLSSPQVEIQASGKPPAVTIVAYTGGLMTVPSWGPVAIDLAGIDASAEQVGILADHDSRLSGIVGHGKAVVANGRLAEKHLGADAAQQARDPRATSRATWDAAQRAVAKRRADAGKARPTKRTLLASLLVCKRCGHSFTTIRDRRCPGPTGEGYRYYTCSGYHRYGKGVCRLTNLPGPALDAFVLQTIKRVLLGDHETTKKAIDAFVAAVLAPKAATKRSSKADDRELDLLNRKIKATVAMLADPTFDGLDELRTTLSELKAKRDAVEARRKPTEELATPALSEKELRTWALEQIARLDDLATRTTVDLKDRQMVEVFVERIEINPEAKTGVVCVAADLEGALLRSSTRLPIGDYMGAHEWSFYGWREGAAHRFYGPNNVPDLWHVKKIPPQQTQHLTQKPAELAARAMLYSTVAGENVLDLFGGSGSTLIAAEQTGRKAFLMELDPLYCDVICDRFQRFSGRPATLDRTGTSPIPMKPREEAMR